MKEFNKKGITMLEIIMSISILGIILFISVPQLASFRNIQSLKNTTENIASLLNEARTLTISSRNSSFYSVRFEDDRAILFTGGSFDENDDENIVMDFESNVTLPEENVLINDSVNEISFNRLTGETNNYGTITIELESDSTVSRTISISKTGIVSSN
jgi:Tfp pilus assembly protein FimT